MIWEHEMEESRRGLPRLVDIIHFATEGTPDERLYFSRFGFDKLSVHPDCPMVASRMEALTELFNERYLFRRIAQETMPRWQVRLQTRMDTIIRRYERGYEMYALYDQKMKEDAIDGETETIKGQRSKLSGKDTVSGSSSGSTNTTDKSRVADTPDSEINDSDRYAGTVSSGTSGSTRSDSASTDTRYGRTDDVDLTTVKTITGKGVVANVNEGMDSWRDLDVRFVGEFEDLFLNVFE